ncbi:MAG: hypothetical protein ACK4PR_05795, partial [Gammaproteobacteria bacterium]
MADPNKDDVKHNTFHYVLEQLIAAQDKLFDARLPINEPSLIALSAASSILNTPISMSPEPKTRELHEKIISNDLAIPSNALPPSIMGTPAPDEQGAKNTYYIEYNNPLLTMEEELICTGKEEQVWERKSSFGSFSSPEDNETFPHLTESKVNIADLEQKASASQPIITKTETKPEAKQNKQLGLEEQIIKQKARAKFIVYQQAIDALARDAHQKYNPLLVSCSSLPANDKVVNGKLYLKLENGKLSYKIRTPDGLVATADITHADLAIIGNIHNNADVKSYKTSILSYLAKQGHVTNYQTFEKQFNYIKKLHEESEKLIYAHALPVGNNLQQKLNYIIDENIYKITAHYLLPEQLTKLIGNDLAGLLGNEIEKIILRCKKEGAQLFVDKILAEAITNTTQYLHQDKLFKTSAASNDKDKRAISIQINSLLNTLIPAAEKIKYAIAKKVRQEQVSLMEEAAKQTGWYTFQRTDFTKAAYPELSNIFQALVTDAHKLDKSQASSEQVISVAQVAEFVPATNAIADLLVNNKAPMISSGGPAIQHTQAQLKTVTDKSLAVRKQQYETLRLTLTDINAHPVKSYWFDLANSWTPLLNLRNSIGNPLDTDLHDLLVILMESDEDGQQAFELVKRLLDHFKLSSDDENDPYMLEKNIQDFLHELMASLSDPLSDEMQDAMKKKPRLAKCMNRLLRKYDQGVSINKVRIEQNDNIKQAYKLEAGLRETLSETEHQKRTDGKKKAVRIAKLMALGIGVGSGLLTAGAIMVAFGWPFFAIGWFFIAGTWANYKLFDFFMVPFMTRWQMHGLKDAFFGEDAPLEWFKKKWDNSSKTGKIGIVIFAFLTAVFVVGLTIATTFATFTAAMGFFMSGGPIIMIGGAALAATVATVTALVYLVMVPYVLTNAIPIYKAALITLKNFVFGSPGDPSNTIAKKMGRGVLAG